MNTNTTIVILVARTGNSYAVPQSEGASPSRRDDAGRARRQFGSRHRVSEESHFRGQDIRLTKLKRRCRTRRPSDSPDRTEGYGSCVSDVSSAAAAPSEALIVLYGDCPLLCAGTVDRLLAHHRKAGAAATVIGASLAEPSGYGTHLESKGKDLFQPSSKRRSRQKSRRRSSKSTRGFIVSNLRLCGSICRRSRPTRFRTNIT